MHAAKGLAQWLDNDEDGVVDCPQALEAMVASDAIVIMAADGEEQSVVEPAAHALGLGQTQGCRASQTFPDREEFDTGPLEEILHLVVSLIIVCGAAASCRCWECHMEYSALPT